MASQRPIVYRERAALSTVNSTKANPGAMVQSAQVTLGAAERSLSGGAIAVRERCRRSVPRDLPRRAWLLRKGSHSQGELQGEAIVRVAEIEACDLCDALQTI